MYISTVEMIKSIVQGLGSSDDEGWHGHAILARNALAEARNMATPRPRPDKGPVQIVPGDHSMQVALPHLQRMLDAIHTRNRVEAVQHGKAALAEFGIDLLSGA